MQRQPAGRAGAGDHPGRLDHQDRRVRGDRRAGLTWPGSSGQPLPVRHRPRRRPFLPHVRRCWGHQRQRRGCHRDRGRVRTRRRGCTRPLLEAAASAGAAFDVTRMFAAVLGPRATGPANGLTATVDMAWARPPGPGRRSTRPGRSPRGGGAPPRRGTSGRAGRPPRRPGLGAARGHRERAGERGHRRRPGTPPATGTALDHALHRHRNPGCLPGAAEATGPRCEPDRGHGPRPRPGRRDRDRWHDPGGGIAPERGPARAPPPAGPESGPDGRPGPRAGHRHRAGVRRGRGHRHHRQRRNRPGHRPPPTTSRPRSLHLDRHRAGQAFAPTGQTEVAPHPRGGHRNRGRVQPGRDADRPPLEARSGSGRRSRRRRRWGNTDALQAARPPGPPWACRPRSPQTGTADAVGIGRPPAGRLPPAWTPPSPPGRRSRWPRPPPPCGSGQTPGAGPGDLQPGAVHRQQPDGLYHDSYAVYGVAGGTTTEHRDPLALVPASMGASNDGRHRPLHRSEPVRGRGETRPVGAPVQRRRRPAPAFPIGKRARFVVRERFGPAVEKNAAVTDPQTGRYLHWDGTEWPTGSRSWGALWVGNSGSVKLASQLVEMIVRHPVGAVPNV